MRLAQFILANSEPILKEFEQFARTHTSSGAEMDLEALRDHAAGLLETIASDMQTPQTRGEQKRNSKGDSQRVIDGEEETSAEKHGLDRADRGFTLEEMFAEYRSLRASVIRRWTNGRAGVDSNDLEDLIRFNEAIDKAVAESVDKYATGVARSREMFLGILGHDLRSPLGAVMTASSFLVTEGNLSGDNLVLARRIKNGGERMLSLVDDLLDFTRTRLGRGIPILRDQTDLEMLGRAAVEEVSTHRPEADIRVETSGELKGNWDSERVMQALSNLLGNAVQHGTVGDPVILDCDGRDDEVILEIRNRGPVIDPAQQTSIFNPFKRLARKNADQRSEGSVGLGLYIAQEIAFAHGGRIEVESSEEEGTCFRFHLPRHDLPEET